MALCEASGGSVSNLVGCTAGWRHSVLSRLFVGVAAEAWLHFRFRYLGEGAVCTLSLLLASYVPPLLTLHEISDFTLRKLI